MDTLKETLIKTAIRKTARDGIKKVVPNNSTGRKALIAVAGIALTAAFTFFKEKNKKK